METLTAERMRDLNGMRISKGAVCGFMVGSFARALSGGWFVPAAYIFMFTPLICALDYGLG